MKIKLEVAKHFRDVSFSFRKKFRNRFKILTEKNKINFKMLFIG